MVKKSNLVVVSFYMTRDLKKQLRNFSAKKEVTQSAIMRLALQEYIAKK